MERSVVTEISAKVNTVLKVTGRDEKGFHLIDSVMYAFPVYDEVRVTVAPCDRVTVTYDDMRSYQDDNALRAAKIVKEAFGLPGFDVHIVKRIPSGAGIGGSSADAAGVARCCRELFGSEYTRDFLLKLGADVPFQYSGAKSCRVRSKGENVEPLSLPEAYFTLVWGNTPSSTACVFAAYDHLGGIGGDTDGYFTDLVPFNELETAAVFVNPSQLAARKALCRAGFDRVTMTGSGCGYIGITYDRAENEALFVKASEEAGKLGLNILNSVIKP